MTLELMDKRTTLILHVVSLPELDITQILIEVLLYHKAKIKVVQNNKYCIDSEKANLQAVLYSSNVQTF